MRIPIATSYHLSNCAEDLVAAVVHLPSTKKIFQLIYKNMYNDYDDDNDVVGDINVFVDTTSRDDAPNEFTRCRKKKVRTKYVLVMTFREVRRRDRSYWCVKIMEFFVKLLDCVH